MYRCEHILKFIEHTTMFVDISPLYPILSEQNNDTCIYMFCLRFVFPCLSPFRSGDPIKQNDRILSPRRHTGPLHRHLTNGTVLGFKIGKAGCNLGFAFNEKFDHALHCCSPFWPNVNYLRSFLERLAPLKHQS